PYPSAPHLYTLSLHDALPILLADGAVSPLGADARRDQIAQPGQPLKRRFMRPHRDTQPGDLDQPARDQRGLGVVPRRQPIKDAGDRKSTRLNSSHGSISYAVF